MSALLKSFSRMTLVLNRWCSIKYSSTDNSQYKVETESVKRKRLVYQSRKRGMLENGLLLSTFADRYLDNLDSLQLDQYDLLINQPSNDWELYYWITGREKTPDRYDNETMDMLKEHTRNDDKESRHSQPHLKS